MKDILGQEICIGSMVLWGGGKTQYAGFAGGPKQVVRLTAKRVIIAIKHVKGTDEPVTTAVEADCVVAVDKILVDKEC